MAVGLLPLAVVEHLVESATARPGTEVGTGRERVAFCPQHAIGVLQDVAGGVLVGDDEYDNPEAYASKILELIENRDLLSKIRANARKSVESYDVNKVAPQIMSVYEEVLACRA